MSDWAKFALAGALVIALGAWGIHGGGLAGSSAEEAERKLFTEVTRDLSYYPDMRWAIVQIDGQRVDIAGTAPSAEHLDRARATAREAVWSGGPLVGGVTRVSTKRARVWAQREGPYLWRAELDLNRLVLGGVAPSRQVAEELEIFAGALFSDRRVVNEMTIDQTAPGDGWEPAARGALVVLSHFALGEAELSDFDLLVDGSVESAEDLRGARTSLARLIGTVSALSEINARALRAPGASRPAPAAAASGAPGAAAPSNGAVDEQSEPEAPPPMNPADLRGPALTCQLRFDEALAEARLEFDLSSTELSDENAAVIDRVAEIAADCDQYSLRIAGHTDETGIPALNQALSEQRAHTVIERLVRSGVDPARLSAVGYGAERPVAPNDTEEGRQANRRIEFMVVP